MLRELKHTNHDLLKQNERLEKAFEDVHTKDYLSENKKLKTHLQEMTLM